MGERKVLNKYYSPDFDPNLVPRLKNTAAGKKLAAGGKAAMQKINNMLPFSMQCLSCATFMYRGKKFNTLKENVEGPKSHYLGIARYRFHMKCVVCSGPITYLTDPEHEDYELETGAKRTYEVWKDKQKTEDDAEKAGIGGKEGKNARGEDMTEKVEGRTRTDIERLERRVEESRREGKDMDDLEELRAMNERNMLLAKGGGVGGGGGGGGGAFGGVAPEEYLKRLDDMYKLNETEGFDEEEEERLIKSIKFGAKTQEKGEDIRRIDDDDDDDDGGGDAGDDDAEAAVDPPPPDSQSQSSSSSSFSAVARPFPSSSSLPPPSLTFVLSGRKRKVPPQPPAESATKEPKLLHDGKAPAAKGGLEDLMGAYGSDDD